MVTLSDLENQLQSNIDAARVPGMAVAVVEQSTLTYARGFGVTSVEDGQLPITPDTIFPVGSITKSLTGTAIMRLVDQGVLDLDTPVMTYFPALCLSDPGAATHVTLAHLLSHTSGLMTDGEEFGYREASGLERYIRDELPHIPFVTRPGRRFSYSNPGLALAGYVAQTVTGTPYAELMHDLVFEPLHMARTTFDPTVAMTYPLAQSHEVDDQDQLRVQHRFAHNTGAAPAGFAYSTARDLAHFAGLHLNEGQVAGQQLMRRESIQAMHTPRVALNTPTNDGYGVTFFTDTYRGQLRIGHGGGMRNFSGKLAILPAAQIAIIVLTNRATEAFDLITIVDHILDTWLAMPHATRAAAEREAGEQIPRGTTNGARDN